MNQPIYKLKILNPMQKKIIETNWAHYHYGLPTERKKPKSYSVYSQFGHPIAVNETYQNCMAAIKRLPFANRKGLKPKPNF